MPYINAKLSVKLTDQMKEELKAALGRAITTISGKTETYLMVAIDDGCDIWLGGDNTEPHAFFDVRILGKAPASDFSDMTSELCKIAETLFGISPSCVYVTYAEVENWGWNGRNL